MADALAKLSGVKVLNDSFFNEITVEFEQDAKQVNKALLDRNIIGGAVEGNKMVLAVSELTSQEDIADLVAALNDILN